MRNKALVYALSGNDIPFNTDLEIEGEKSKKSGFSLLDTINNFLTSGTKIYTTTVNANLQKNDPYGQNPAGLRKDLTTGYLINEHGQYIDPITNQILTPEEKRILLCKVNPNDPACKTWLQKNGAGLAIAGVFLIGGGILAKNFIFNKPKK